jgi:hypothetical protein
VNRFLTWRTHATIAETEAHIARCQLEMQSKNYVLVGKWDGKVIGSFALWRPPPGTASDTGMSLLARSGGWD